MQWTRSWPSNAPNSSPVNTAAGNFAPLRRAVLGVGEAVPVVILELLLAPSARGGAERMSVREISKRGWSMTSRVCHLLAGYDLSTHTVYGHVKAARSAPSSLRSAAAAQGRYAPVRFGSRSCSTTSAPIGRRVPTPGFGDWAAVNNVELTSTPF